MAVLISKGTDIWDFFWPAARWTNSLHPPARPLMFIQSFWWGSLTYTVKMVSTTHYYLHVVFMAMGNGYGNNDEMYIPRTREGWGASNCPGPAPWTVCGHVLSMNSSNKYCCNSVYSNFPNLHRHIKKKKEVSQ